MTDIKSWSITASQNGNPVPDGFPEQMAPSGVNDSAREVMAAVRRQWNDAEWFDYGAGDEAPSYSFVSSTVIKVIGGAGVIAEYHAGRRVKYVGAATIYGTIDSSIVNSADLDVTIAWDGGNAINESFSLFLHILRSDVSGLPRNARYVVPSGTAVEPSITSDGDSDTGGYFPAADVFAITTGGAERARFNLNGIALTQGHKIGDLDGDTFIEFENAADDDTIRFDTLGLRRGILGSSGDWIFGNDLAAEINGVPVDAKVYINNETASEHAFVINSQSEDRATMRIHAGDPQFDNIVQHMTVDRPLSSTAFEFYRAQVDLDGTPNKVCVIDGDGDLQNENGSYSGGADYAEMFEWLDGNPSNEDRAGVTVILEGEKIRSAKDGETPIGVISVNGSVVGNSPLNWPGKYQRDEFGRLLKTQTQIARWFETIEERQYDERTETEVVVKRKQKRAMQLDKAPPGWSAPDDATYDTIDVPILSSSFDPSKEYVSRKLRPEWDAVGLMGRLLIKDSQPTAPGWVMLARRGALSEWLVK